MHVQLATKSKLFSSEAVTYGAAANTGVSAITLAHPGTLPRLNRKAVDYAVRMGLACNCGITPRNYFSRKNYFYPDLPKGYQLTQHSTPVCTGGAVTIELEGVEKEIGLDHIHLEEDAGKSLHEGDEPYSSIDLNRAGTPLIEIVTAPDFRNGEEACQFLYEIRKLVRWLGIGDGNMEEGSLRCDVNISVRRAGDSRLGTRVEIKNLNSLRFVREAISGESRRMIELLESGASVEQETRHFDERTGVTRPGREKEEAHDYRYFTEPDLPPFTLGVEEIEACRKQIPELPRKRRARFIREFGLSSYDAGILTEERELADYFEKMLEAGSGPKPSANWIIGPILSWLNANHGAIDSFPISPETMAKMSQLVEGGKMSFSVAGSRLMKELLQDPAANPEAVASAKDLLKQEDDGFLEAIIDEVLRNFAPKVEAYRKGRKGLLALFVGEVMKKTRGKADPEIVNSLILKKINTQ